MRATACVFAARKSRVPLHGLPIIASTFPATASPHLGVPASRVRTRLTGGIVGVSESERILRLRLVRE